MCLIGQLKLFFVLQVIIVCNSHGYHMAHTITSVTLCWWVTISNFLSSGKPLFKPVDDFMKAFHVCFMALNV